MARESLQLVRGDPERERSSDLTIEQLAHETGMTVRNIRAHQARGLLPPPEVRMRVGYYGPEHLERIQLIKELQAEGFNLKGIQWLLGEKHGAAEGLIGLKRVLITPFETEQPQVFTAQELAERFGMDPASEEGVRTLAKGERLGALVPLGDGRYEAPSPSLLDAAEEALRRGIPLSSALRIIERVQDASESVARAFVRLFLEEVWKPFEQEGYPEQRWSEVLEAIEALRPLASKALLAVFQQTMTREVETTFGRELERRFKKRG